MPEPFKNLLGARVVADMAHHLGRSWTGFPRAAFSKDALTGLEALELKQRVVHIAGALGRHLPTRFEQAAEVLEGSLAPAHLDDDLSKHTTSESGLAGWPIWPMTHFVAVHGLESPRRALGCLHALTQRSSAEFAIRAFLDRDLEGTLSLIERWVDDPSPHVRRLVSEGTRPLLPWGLRLRRLVEDPRPTLPLLEALHNDPSEYVRRSVANHVNDHSKHHPELARSLIGRWLGESPTIHQRRLAARALRTLVKKGDAPSLGLLGFGGGKVELTAFRLSPKRLRVGDTLTLTIEIRNAGKRRASVVIDYALHAPKANGTLSPKVFKGTTRELAAGESTSLELRHPLRVVTTRKLRAGRHLVDIRLNGQPSAPQPVHVSLDT